MDFMVDNYEFEDGTFAYMLRRIRNAPEGSSVDYHIKTSPHNEQVEKQLYELYIQPLLKFLEDIREGRFYESAFDV